jgi:hypothetical protein
MFAQAIEQRRAWLNLERMFSAIDDEINSHRGSFRWHGSAHQQPLEWRG